MTPDQLALLGDNSLSDGARLIGLWVAVQEGGEEGWVELPFDEVRTFLHDYPSDSSIRRHLRMLTASGWVERKPGGKGHGDRFRLAPSLSLKNKTRLQPESKSDRLAPSLSLKGPRSSSSKEKEESTQAQAREEYEVSDKAVAVIQQRNSDLDGCRGALRDYLAAAVPTHRQYGYVQTLVTWLAGHDRSVFQLPDGSQLPAEERTGYIATALNELMAGEESKMKGAVGEPRNLKTKLNVLLKQRAGLGPRRSSGRNGRDDVRPFSAEEMETYMELRQQLVAEGMELNAAAEEANRRVIEGEVRA